MCFLAIAVPCIGPIAKIIHQTLTMRNEAKHLEEEWEAVMQRLEEAGRLVVRVGKWCQDRDMNQEDLPSEFRDVLGTLQKDLDTILDALTECSEVKGIKKVLKRTDILRKVKKYDAKLSHTLQIFSITMTLIFFSKKTDCVDFESDGTLTEHYTQGQDHHYCEECDRHFKFEESRKQHMGDKHWYCRQHDQVFKFAHGLNSHYRQSMDHHFCFDCEVNFDDEDKLWDHSVEDHDACGECHLLFDNYSELEEHDREVHIYCSGCDRYFQNQQSLRQHLNSTLHQPSKIVSPGQEDSNSQWACDDCDLSFESDDALTANYTLSQDLHYCEECHRHFKFEESRKQHMGDKHWYCRQHDQVFKFEHDLHSHYRQSMDHHYCFDCEVDFDDKDGLWDHSVEYHHGCRECHLPFDSYSELEEHDHEVHDFCTKCDRGFQNQYSLQQHLNSKLHRPSNIICPGSKCNKQFISPSALTLHFESGACRSGITRQKLDRIVVQADQNNYITNPARLLGGPPGEYEPPMSATAWATERSWNGFEYECFLCHSTFKALDRLNQHLQSPRHEQKIYRCPKADCSLEFVALSALSQHVERGSCGVKMFKDVQDAMESLTRGFNAISFG